MIYPAQMTVSTRMQAKPFAAKLADGRVVTIAAQWQSGSWMSGRTACGLLVKQQIGASVWALR